ncbi:hypothetical protein V1264_018260 [Littorina saxatilis]|uniref:Uncharacterized protein n=1 Tax=Littorina saxatilis TaxID=31220 RepID=A0AAN9BDY1_9CAEN
MCRTSCFAWYTDHSTPIHNLSLNLEYNRYFLIEHFYSGIEHLHSGIEHIYSGIEHIHSGIRQINSGIEQIHSGIEQIHSEMEQILKSVSVSGMCCPEVIYRSVVLYRLSPRK